MLGSVSCSVNLAVEGRGIEFGDSDITLVQRVKAVLVVITAGLAVGTEFPKSLPAIDGNTAGRRGRIGKGIQHGRVDVGIGCAADFILAVPGIAAVDDICPVIKVQFFSVSTELIVAVEHQDILNDDAVGLAGIDKLADVTGPGRGPVDNAQIFIFTIDKLAPAGLVQTEDQVTVFVLVGGLNGGSITGDDAVVVDADGKAGFLGFLDEPGGALGGIGVGIDPDGITGVIHIFFRGFCVGFRRCGFDLSRCGGLAAGNQSNDHAESQKQCEILFHDVSSIFLLFQRPSNTRNRRIL